MKAEDLRIGNLFEYRNRIYVVQSIEFNESDLSYTIFDALGGEHFLEHIEPIPLTEDWLLKFGFEKHGHEYNYFNDVLEISLLTNTVKYHNTLITEIKLVYIHQLQNLYFALTQEELELK